MSFNPVHEYSEFPKLVELCGSTINAFEQAENYWRPSVVLRTVDGNSIVFSTIERQAGHCFEVFPLAFAIEKSSNERAKLLPACIAIQSAQALWRMEWLEEGAWGATVGANPKTQYAGRGPVPPEAISSARVLAGVLLRGLKGERLIVASSDSAPFNVEIAFAEVEIDRMLEGFESSPLGK